MTRDEHFQYQTFEQAAWCFVRVLCWLLVGLLGLYVATVLIFFGTDVIWSTKAFYYSLAAVLTAPWRIYRNIKVLDRQILLRARQILPQRTGHSE